MDRTSLGTPASGFNTNASFASADTGVTPAFNWNNGFPQNFAHPPIISPTVQNGQAAQVSLRSHGGVWPYSQQWNLTVEKQIGGDVCHTHILRRGKGNAPDRRRCHELEPGGPDVSGARQSAECEHQLRAGESGGVQRAVRRLQRSVGNASVGGAGAASVPAVCRSQPVQSELRRFDLPLVPAFCAKAGVPRAGGDRGIYVLESDRQHAQLRLRRGAAEFLRSPQRALPEC